VETTTFAGWSDFYVIVGGSAAALTGLQFVVITLAADVGMGTTMTTSAFATPTIVHFCGVLLIAAILSTPWPGLGGPAIAIGAAGGAGLAYTIVVIRAARAQHHYVPVVEDWIWFICLPAVAYALLVVSAAWLQRRTATALFGVAASALLLLFVGIHNAWDSATYIAQSRPDDASAD